MTNRVYTVGQINRYIRGLFAGDAMLSGVFVRGEVSNCKYHSSGHIYFSIKDATGTLSCILFAGNRRGLAFRMKDGDKVVVGGTIDVYERDGRYQLYAKEIRLEGEGELYERFVKLKKALEAEGLFRQELKKPIPKFAATVGVVTAPTGAAIRDIQTISARRNPFVQVILYPALVQGQGAARSVAEGIRMLDGLVDVIIVGRGGGSLEDLWAFNEEAVARAIYEAETPVISAVGHETDTTIADYAADLRAPTPSAAAEIAVFDLKKFNENRAHYALQLTRGFESRLRRYQSSVDLIRSVFRRCSPEAGIRDARRRAADLDAQMERDLKERIETAKRRADEYKRDLAPALSDKLRTARTDLENRSELMRRDAEAVLIKRRSSFSVYIAKMQGLNPILRLSQGYSYTEDRNGCAVRSVRQVASGDPVLIRVADGRIRAEVKETIQDE